MEILGKGSMGSVSRVRKRDEAVGGSARPQFVKKHCTPPPPPSSSSFSSPAAPLSNRKVLQSCGLSGCCPFSPFTRIKGENAFAWIGGGSNGIDDENSITSDLTCSNQKKVKHHQTPSMLSWPRSASRDSSTQNKNRYTTQKTGSTWTGLRTCIGIKDESPSKNNSSVPSCQSTNEKAITRPDSERHLQPSSMIRSHKGKKAPSSSSSSSSPSSFYALKSIHLNRCSSPEYQLELKNEVEILKSLDHPNIVRAIETFDFRHRLFIVLELCSGGDLYTREPYTEAAAKRICKSIFSAVAYLHSKGIIHRGEFI
jgi:serine/threonine protein kinase